MTEKWLSPRELAMQQLGYIPDGTPETWEEVQQETLRRNSNVIYVNGEGLDMKGPVAHKIVEKLLASEGGDCLMAVTRIPNFYRPGIGTGGPLRWQGDVTGV